MPVCVASIDILESKVYEFKNEWLMCVFGTTMGQLYAYRIIILRL